ncbi:dienelactone hydrolase-like enzyme [Halobiforma nitratireducens JCM 10879]|uniref:Dienelactone hydrolase-like enzyme n=2 Tax=Halobiforma nitratireducens TaxID=130048 RepID=M0M5E7_9EURY|nr:dienelactone hydrolase-like enzyme [Halobiforma nitratireducens JCM 10879]
MASTGATLLTGVAGCLGDDPEEDVTFDHPDDVRADEPFELTIDGLPEETPVEVAMESDSGIDATVTVETDSDGRIDLADQSVVDGDVPTDLDIPTTVALIQFASESFWQYQPPEEERVTYSVRTDDEEYGSTELRRSHLDRSTYDDPAHSELVGGVFTPPIDDEGPGILVLHGSEGEPLFEHAATLAHRGFTTFALHYFDGPGLPDDLVEIPLEYVETAAQWLLEHERVSSDRVGVIGMSKGGELGLLAGSRSDEIGPVVSIVGSGLVWEGINDTGVEPPETSSWSIDGEPVPYVPYDRGPFEDDVSMREFYTQSLEAARADTIDEATIPVEEIDGDVLLVSAGNDELWPTERLHNVTADRLEERPQSTVEHLRYGDAGHGIFPPYSPVMGTNRARFGGSRAGNARAAHDHWPAVLETLATLD